MQHKEGQSKRDCSPLTPSLSVCGAGPRRPAPMLQIGRHTGFRAALSLRHSRTHGWAFFFISSSFFPSPSLSFSVFFLPLYFSTYGRLPSKAQRFIHRTLPSSPSREEKERTESMLFLFIVPVISFDPLLLLFVDVVYSAWYSFFSSPL